MTPGQKRFIAAAMRRGSDHSLRNPDRGGRLFCAGGDVKSFGDVGERIPHLLKKLTSSYAMIDAAVSGLRIAYVPEDIVASHIASGELDLILDDWSPMFDGYFLYYPSRRQTLAAFQIVVDALRHRKR